MSILDLFQLGWRGIRGELGRALLSAVGIGIGIATLIMVLGIPASGQARLNADITKLGTNLLVAHAVATSGEAASFPSGVRARATRIAPVQHVATIANIGLPVARSKYSEASDTVGITPFAIDGPFAKILRVRLTSGAFLPLQVTAAPEVALGAESARALGISNLPPGDKAPIVLIGGAPFIVVGILQAIKLAPDLNSGVFISTRAASLQWGPSSVGEVILSADESQIGGVRDVLPVTLNPETPGLVQLDQPSGALAAKRETNATFSGLFVGLAAVALGVGGIGVANTMIVSVLERRREIGLRRALGASKTHIRLQFLVEAVLLSLLGGAIGALLGTAGTAAYTIWRDWPTIIAPTSLLAGLLGSTVIGVTAGLYPAFRASALPPTEALE